MNRTKKDILFIGGYFDEYFEKEILIKSRSAVHYPANKFQYNLIDGFLQNNKSVFVLSASFLGTFPQEYTDLKIQEREILFKNEEIGVSVRYNNLWGYRNISRTHQLKRKIDELRNQYDFNKIVVYSPHTPFLKAGIYAKKQFDDAHLCLIVPDLPQFMNLSSKKSKLYSYLKEFDNQSINKLSLEFDSYVFITKQMQQVFGNSNNPYIVVPGIVNDKNLIENGIINNSNSEKIVYTGTLNAVFGVPKLIESFEQLNKKFKSLELHICGVGDSENLLIEKSMTNANIIYHGQVTNDEAVKLQQQATVLVNPRPNEGEYTKYSFPSKTFEYMLAEKPVVGYKLDGIPAYFKDYIFLADRNNTEDLTREIEKVLSLNLNERKQIGEISRNFALKEFNARKVTNDILEMIEG